MNKYKLRYKLKMLLWILLVWSGLLLCYIAGAIVSIPLRKSLGVPLVINFPNLGKPRSRIVKTVDLQREIRLSKSLKKRCGLMLELGEHLVEYGKNRQAYFCLRKAKRICRVCSNRPDNLNHLLPEINKSIGIALTTIIKKLPITHYLYYEEALECLVEAKLSTNREVEERQLLKNERELKKAAKRMEAERLIGDQLVEPAE